LRNAGQRGITQVSFLGPMTCDGGPPITRLAARIGELREEGYKVGQNGRRDKCVVYVLAGAEAVPPPPIVESVPEPEPTLFEPSAVSRPLGAYDDWDEAAA